MFKLNFANLASGETGIGYQSPQPCFRIIGRELCFHKIGPINDAKKNRLQDFYDMFYLHM